MPKLRFPEFNEEWEETKLEKISEKISDGIHSTPKYKDGTDYFFVNGNNLVNKSILVNENTKTVSEEEYEKYKKNLSEHTILISINGTIGNLAYYNNEKVILGKSAAYINLKSNFVKEFICNYIQTHKIKSFFNGELTGTTIKNLSLATLKNTPLFLPNLEEQEKIASFLSKVDEKIEKLEKKQELWETYKKGIMQQIFSQKLRFKDENGEDYPDWEEKKLRDICRINKGSQLNKSEMVENGTYYVLNGGMEPSGYTNEWNTPKNTITISEGGNSCGYANFNIENFWCGGHCYALVNLKNIELYFLFQSLKYMEKHLMSLRVGSGLPNIQKKDLQSFRIDIPVRNEQIKIGDLFLGFDIKINLIRKELQITKKFKKGLLQQMFC